MFDEHGHRGNPGPGEYPRLAYRAPEREQAGFRLQQARRNGFCHAVRSRCLKVLVVSANQNRLPLPVFPMGACMVAQAAERAGHEVELLDLMFEASPQAAAAQALRRFQPDIVGLSVRNIDNNDMQETAFYLHDLQRLMAALRRETAAPIVIGGAAMNVMPEQVLRAAECDWGVTGDGEIGFPLLLGRIADGKPFENLPGIVYIDGTGRFRDNPPVRVRQSASCPSPDFSSWLDTRSYGAHMAAAPVQSKLGCQFNCVYCTYRKIEGSTYHLYSADSVADAVCRYAAAGLKDLEFVDNVFNVPYDHALGVCACLARRDHGARLQTLELNPLCVSDMLLSAMERAGFVGIGITAESASDSVLQGLRKGFTSREVFHAADVVRRHRLPCTWIFLLGGPGETMQTARETIRFARGAVRPRDTAFFNVGIRVYPGTELEQIARDQGLLTAAPADMLEPVFYVSPRVNTGWLQQLVRDAAAGTMNFLSPGSIGLPFLPLLHRMARRVGVRPPLWRYTPAIRRCLAFAGISTV